MIKGQRQYPNNIRGASGTTDIKDKPPMPLVKGPRIGDALQSPTRSTRGLGLAPPLGRRPPTYVGHVFTYSATRIEAFQAGSGGRTPKENHGDHQEHTGTLRPVMQIKRVVGVGWNGLPRGGWGRRRNCGRAHQFVKRVGNGGHAEPGHRGRAIRATVGFAQNPL